MVLCVLAEACVCWTFNGLGMCLLLLAVMGAVYKAAGWGPLLRLRARILEGEGGRP